MTHPSAAPALPESKMPHWWIFAVLAMVIFAAGLWLYPRLPLWASVAPGLGLSLGLLFTTLCKLLMWHCRITTTYGDDNVSCAAALAGWLIPAVLLGFASGWRAGVAYCVCFVVSWALVILIRPVRD